VFCLIVRRHRLSRREALGLGAAAVAGSLVRARPALALPRAFELDLAAEGAPERGGAGWRTSGVLRAPRRFDLIGLRWARGARIEAQVRARRRGGGWTPWVPLAAAPGHGPDGGRAPAGSDPVWTGAADLFQLRLRGSARDLRARFVRSQPAAAAARRLARRSRRARAAQAGAPRIVSRAEWGGDAHPPRHDPGYGQVQLAFVHHTVTANDYAPTESAGIVLGICRYHRDTNRWNDIGYNFLVDRYGQVFEGRAGGVHLAVVGAQAQGYNSVSTGVACLGDFSAIPQSEPGVDALARLLAWKLSLHGVPVQGRVVVTSGGGESNRHPAGTPVTFERISGHRDGDRTSCPGDVLYAQLADLRARAARYAVPVSRVTVRSGARRVRAGRPAPLSGELRFADGSSAGGAPLDVEFQTAGSAWTRLTGATAGADGRWAAAVALPATGLVRAVFPGDGARPRLESRPAAITLVPRLTLALVPRRLRAGRVVRVAGTLAPARPVRVTCLVERRSGRRWVRVQRKRINVRGGRFSTRLRLRRPGLYRVSIVTAGATIRRLVRATRGAP
jgi:hypothetical protein